jgi:hypothetical protein
MGRLLVEIGRGVDVGPAALAAAWNADEETRGLGTAVVESARTADVFSVMDLVVLPTGIGLAVNAITALVSSLLARLRAKPDVLDLEIFATTKANGDQVIAVHLRKLPG